MSSQASKKKKRLQRTPPVCDRRVVLVRDKQKCRMALPPPWRDGEHDDCHVNDELGVRMDIFLGPEPDGLHWGTLLVWPLGEFNLKNLVIAATFGLNEGIGLRGRLIHSIEEDRWGLEVSWCLDKPAKRPDFDCTATEPDLVAHFEKLLARQKARGVVTLVPVPSPATLPAGWEHATDLLVLKEQLAFRHTASGLLTILEEALDGEGERWRSVKIQLADDQTLVPELVVEAGVAFLDAGRGVMLSGLQAVSGFALVMSQCASREAVAYDCALTVASFVQLVRAEAKREALLTFIARVAVPIGSA